MWRAGSFCLPAGQSSDQFIQNPCLSVKSVAESLSLGCVMYLNSSCYLKIIRARFTYFLPRITRIFTNLLKKSAPIREIRGKEVGLLRCNRRVATWVILI